MTQPRPAPPRNTPRRAASCMRQVAAFLVYLTFLALVVAIVFYSVDLYRHGTDHHYIAWFSSGAFVLLTVPISMREIILHLSHWYMPDVQKYVVRILWMIPLYSVESWLSLRFRRFSLYIETVRECYEAYVIYSFVYYLIALLGEELALAELLRNKPPSKGRHWFPLNWCMRPWTMGHEFLRKCKVGVLQYVIVKNLMAITIIVLENLDLYGENHFDLKKGYMWVTIVNNCSQLWAIYVLVLFYQATAEELKPWRPVSKFLCVKLIVFFTWWQSVMMGIAQQMNLIHDSYENWTNEEIAKGLQDYLICIEMFFAAFAITYAFTYKDYLPEDDGRGDRKPFLKAFWQSSMPHEMFVDIHRAATGRLAAQEYLPVITEEEDEAEYGL